MPGSANRFSPGYVAVLIAAFAVSLFAAWTALGTQVDNYAYDLLFRNLAPDAGAPRSVILALDEPTLAAHGGTRKLREILALGLESIAPAPPLAVAIDVVVADAQEEAVDARLEAALAATRKPILPSELVEAGWENPLPRFRGHAFALGHVHAEQNRADGVARQLPLESIARGERRWALALEAARAALERPILESPEDLTLGDITIPAPRSAAGRLMRIYYRRQPIPTVSLADLVQDPRRAAALGGKVVFVGVTALSAARDRVVNPLGESIPGVEVHAQAFETIAGGRFLRDASNLAILLTCIAIAAAMGVVFAYFSGWNAYGAAAVVLGLAHLVPLLAFRREIVFPFTSPVSVAWLSLAGAASWQYFFVQRRLRKSEEDRRRYQQAIHFVTHEMRSPLTAIQGSSELMGRYNLNDDKRKQLANTINAESKRLARMIQTFLDVERLTAGEMDLKSEPFAFAGVVDVCLERVRPLADRKNIRIHPAAVFEAELRGDRELMEYAVYNLLTNAVKYSPSGTEVFVTAEREGGRLRLSVRDQGIGMDAKELKQIFQKFYRTKKAEASGEAGTGIGLSIVEQIVTHHGGKMEVTSEPGKGSCFTMVLPCPAIRTAPDEVRS